ncbi:MAG: Asp-tRNA(Asn)/Glu-tRNA(Gln) amidotransferase subunit GatA [Candidatus Kerfeldbacteria bacterium]|nr:Asp-tRNA(Asn)/Glu-tRNA(Gln) amidotransferase subunit GatA [Candidatus Kerfeldbacteria bacterium]
MELADLTIASLRDGVRAKQFSCADVLRAYGDRITRIDSSLNAFLHVTHDQAIKKAKDWDAKLAAGERLPSLAGVPLAVKDVLATRGVPTTAGSRILRGYVPPYTATAVERLEQEGAIVLGKTNCDEFAMGASGENSAYGPTKNPWDLTRVPGGSSSGSAAAVAAGEALAALGTDTGGSIRQPAGFCGVVGLKPTYGRVSRYGVLALASSLDQIGPFARTVEDAAELLNAMCGRDDRDATSVDRAGVDLDVIRTANVKGMTLGMPKQYFLEGMDPEVETIVRDAAALLEKQGASVVEVDLPHTEYALAVYYLLQPSEASSNLARYDGIRYGAKQHGASLDEDYFVTRSAGFGAEVKRRIMLGTFALSAGYHDAYYGKAQRVRTLIRKDFTEAFTKVDALITPTSPGVPFALGEKSSDPLTMYLADIFTVSANIAGIPGLSVPGGIVRSLPVGVQILGPLWSEERLLTLGVALEHALALPRTLSALPS